MFSRTEAVEAALALGIDRFTMSDVARKVGVTPPAVYRRFPSRNDLLETAIDHAMRNVVPVDTDNDVDGTLRCFAHQWWILFIRYPGLHRLVSVYDSDPTRFFHGAFATHRAHLQSSGLTPRQTVFAGDLIIGTLARLRTHSPDGDATSVDTLSSERSRLMGFLLAALHANWPEWVLDYVPAEPFPCGVDAGSCG